eukprot:TRINITY_DN2897_c0_g1_i2.p1 TRINITY_DN2897_c0_g1~~TRINITY_DN2897_c0_g1_i2.p1  ORF type:complete len:205 (-),score=23.58 TRINITY_DN2897_c0_g1_i2:555-1169(-)
MATTSSVRDAIKNWELEETERRRKEAAAKGETFEGTVIASQEHVVRLIGRLPPITKLDKDIISLQSVVHLGLSTNAIDKITPHFRELPNLEILSLGRNNIRKLENLDLPNLKELWISNCRIEKLTGLDRLRSLQTLHIGNNMISSWIEVERYLPSLPALTDLSLISNPIERQMQHAEYRLQVLVRIPRVAKLDGRARRVHCPAA